MKTTFLDFEQPIAELEQRIEELRFVQDDSAVDISEEIQRLTKKSQALTKEIFEDRMFPLTIEGLDGAMRELSR